MPADTDPRLAPVLSILQQAPLQAGVAASWSGHKDGVKPSFLCLQDDDQLKVVRQLLGSCVDAVLVATCMHASAGDVFAPLAAACCRLAMTTE